MAAPAARDLYVLAADVHIGRTVETLLSRRCPAMGIRNMSFRVDWHPRNDPGCRTESVGALRDIRRDYHRAMVVFDYSGCGAGNVTAVELEARLERELATAG